MLKLYYYHTKRKALALLKKHKTKRTIMGKPIMDPKQGAKAIEELLRRDAPLYDRPDRFCGDAGHQ